MFCCPKLAALPVSACGHPRSSSSLTCTSIALCDPHLEGDFPWFVHPVPWSPLKPLGRMPGKAVAWCDHDHVLLHHLSCLVHPLSDFIGEVATWKKGRKVYSQSPSLRLRFPPSNNQNILASVSRGGNLEKCQALLITIKLLFKECIWCYQGNHPKGLLCLNHRCIMALNQPTGKV